MTSTTSIQRVAVLLLSTVVDGGRAPPLKLSSTLARATETDTTSAAGAAPYAILATTSKDAELMNSLFGTNLPSAGKATELHADLCALGGGAPALVCLATARDGSGDTEEAADVATMVAFALADVWFASLPAGARSDEQVADDLLQRIFALLDRLPAGEPSAV